MFEKFRSETITDEPVFFASATIEDFYDIWELGFMNTIRGIRKSKKRPDDKTVSDEIQN